MHSKASWMDQQSPSVLENYEEVQSDFGLEKAKIKFNATAALEHFQSSNSKWEMIWFGCFGLQLML